MSRKRYGLTEWQRHRLKVNIKGLARFVFTVAASCFLALWLEHRHPLAVNRAMAYVSRAPRRLMSYPPRPAAVASSRQGAAPKSRSLGDHYSHYLDEALPLLRSDMSVRMVKVELPAIVLDFQKNVVGVESGASFHLEATAERIPALAISRNAKDFLTTMKITFIDPMEMPEARLPSLGLFAKGWQSQYLLVPDPSGAQAHYFVYSRK